MRNKTLLLATTALALIASPSSAQADGLYISIFGGLNFQSDSSGSQTSSGTPSTFTAFSEDADTGFVLGGTVGASLDKWLHGLRAEVEASYRRNDIQGAWINVIDFSASSSSEAGPLTANVSNFALLANVWYDVEMGWKVKPYLGGGVGWARAKLDGAAAVTTSTGCCALDGAQTFSRENSGFAWQLGAGFNYEASPGVNVGLGYRYFRGPDFDPIFIGKNNLPVGFDNDNHSVAANLTIAIN